MNSLFRVSERNHYGLIFMTQLAGLPADERLSLKEAAEDMGMPAGYLEEIARLLKEAGLVSGRQGPGGGYCLARPAGEITAEEIVTALEGPVSLVYCLAKDAECPVNHRCQTKTLWSFLQSRVLETLRDTTLKQLSASL